MLNFTLPGSGTNHILCSSPGSRPYGPQVPMAVLWRSTGPSIIWWFCGLHLALVGAALSSLQRPGPVWSLPCRFLPRPIVRARSPESRGGWGWEAQGPGKGEGEGAHGHKGMGPLHGGAVALLSFGVALLSLGCCGPINFLRRVHRQLLRQTWHRHQQMWHQRQMCHHRWHHHWHHHRLKA